MGGAEAVDFEAAEKKAREEAERIEKLGYDPEAEAVAAGSNVKLAAVSERTKIAAPTPLSPAKAGFGATKGHERNSSEVERLGMGVGKLGFGQVGGAKNAAPASKKIGFGSTGTSRAVQKGESIPSIP